MNRIHSPSYRAGLRQALKQLEAHRLPGKTWRNKDIKLFHKWLAAVSADEDDYLFPNSIPKAEIWKQVRGGRWVCKNSSLTREEFIRYRRAAELDGHEWIEFKCK